VTRLLELLAFAVLLAAAVPSMAAAPEDKLADRVLGNSEAPVTIVEYSSFTCPHCADFHLQTLPRIRQAYIDTGKARLIFRDFPLDGRALAAAMIARCVAPERYYGFVEILFRDQQAWATSDQPLRELKQRAKLALLPEPAVDACIADQALAKGIEERARQAAEAHGIRSTPSFLVGDRKIRGAAPYEDFAAAIDAALGGAPENGKKAETGGPAAPIVPASAPEGLFGGLWGRIERLWRSK
jgi:protein-disulfide isomerase